MPQRRVRPLHWLDDQRDVFQAEELADMIEAVGAQSLEHDLEYFVEALLGGGGLDAEERRLVGRGAAADAEPEPAGAHEVQHADLFDQPERMIEAERVGKRSEAKRRCALGDGGEEEAGRGR